MKSIHLVAIFAIVDIALLVYGLSSHIDFQIADNQLRIVRTDWFSEDSRGTVVPVKNIAKIDFEGTAYTKLGKRRRHSGGVFLVFDNASNRMELPLPGSPGVKWDKRFSALDFYHSLEEGIKVGSFKRRIWTYAGDARELSYLPTLLLLAFGLRAIVEFSKRDKTH